MGSTYVQNPPYLKDHENTGADRRCARRADSCDVRDKITTGSHLASRRDQADISGRQYLLSHQVRLPTSTSTARGAATTK